MLVVLLHALIQLTAAIQNKLFDLTTHIAHYVVHSNF